MNNTTAAKEEMDHMTNAEKVEQSILGEFRETIWLPFLEAVKRYELIANGDKVTVCISGGKDSMLMAKLIQLYQRAGEVAFDAVYLVMDPGYNAVNRKRIEDNAALLDIPITVFESNIFEVTNKIEKSPCYLCARMRRGHLYAKAREYGCHKIALGHHFSDVIETTLIGMFYGSQLQGMLPKLHSSHFEGMELIRPMYCIHEEEIIRWCRHNGLEFIQCACRFTENSSRSDNGENVSKRQEVKEFIKRMKRENPVVEQSIFESLHNVDLDGVAGYKTNGVTYGFGNEK